MEVGGAELSPLHAWLLIRTLTLTRQRGDTSRRCRGAAAAAADTCASTWNLYKRLVFNPPEKNHAHVFGAAQILGKRPHRRSKIQGLANFNEVGRSRVAAAAWLGGKGGSQTGGLTDEGWQKVMPHHIELWDVSFLDSSNQRWGAGVCVCGGVWRSPGARLRSMGAGTLSLGGCRVRSGGVGGGWWCHCNVSLCQPQSSLALIF